MNGPWVPALLQLLRASVAPGVLAKGVLIDGSSTKALGTACPVPLLIKSQGAQSFIYFYFHHFEAYMNSERWQRASWPEVAAYVGCL